MLDEVKTIDPENVIHGAKLLRLAEKHKIIADSWRRKARAGFAKLAKQAHADPKHGLKKMAKKIGKPAANPLIYVARDDKAGDGGKVGTLTANPRVVDGIITRAWQKVYEGNAQDVDKLVQTFIHKYRKTLRKQGEFKAPNLTTNIVFDGLTKAGETAGGMDGWQPAELALASWEMCRWIRHLFELIESGTPWPKSCLHAVVRYLEKDGSVLGEVMSYRPLTISVPIYRRWAAMRLLTMIPWVEGWALEEMFAGIPGQGAVDAWYQTLMDIEMLLLDGTPFCGGAADIHKFFDQIQRRLVYEIL